MALHFHFDLRGSYLVVSTDVLSIGEPNTESLYGGGGAPEKPDTGTPGPEFGVLIKLTLLRAGNNLLTNWFMQNNVNDTKYVYKYLLIVLLQDQTVTNLFQTNPFGKCVYKRCC